MKVFLLLLFCLLLSIPAIFAQHRPRYAVISYLKIKVDSLGNLPQNPYVLDLTHGARHLIAIGTQHSMDTTSSMFSVIEKSFYKLKPDVIINEGGNLTKHYTSRNDGISRSGELGLEKFLADKEGLKTVNGDMPDKLEFDELKKRYSKKEALICFAAERFIFPYIFGQNHGDLRMKYEQEFIKDYLLAKKINLTAEEQSFKYFTKAYKKWFKKKFSTKTISQLDFAPFGTRNHFNTVTRSSKELRDQYLLYIVQEQLNYHDKILLVFGGWHILSIEPALKKIMGEN